MDKILIPTDFSSNSMPGLRFGVRMAARSNAALVFLHVVPLNEDQEKAKDKLDRFIKKLYLSMKLEPQQIQMEVVAGFKADVSILQFLQQNPDINFVCISTRGASFFNKVLGTNSSNLIEKSGVPVMIIPCNYRVKPLNSILFATDFNDFERELSILVEFARPKGLSIEVLHFDTFSGEAAKNKSVDQDWEANVNYPLTISILKANPAHSLVRQIKTQVKRKKPSMLCLFTNADRGFFEKILLGSITEKISYQADVPLLTFKKNRQ